MGTLDSDASSTTTAQLDHLSRFVGSLNHELCTPLASLRLLLDLAEQGELDAVPGKLVSMREVVDQVRRLLRTVSELTKLESGRRQTARLETEVEGLLSDLASGVTTPDALIPAHALGVRRRSPLPAAVRTDRGAVLDAVRALAAFAVETGGSADVTVSAADGSLWFEVEARAPSSDAWRLPVQAADLAASRRTGGSGLELSVAAAFAEALDGELVADLGAETGLRLRLPIG
ncbi:MAG: histidine kinase dimerization/phospho-acceptor domain-containing protein [Acidobacteriota bacterium]